MPRIAILAVLLAGCAAGRSATADADRVPEAIAAGAATSCIPITLIRESRVQSDRVIDFVMKNRRIFRNTLTNDCPGLGYERRISYTTPLSQLCAADLVTVLTTGPVQRGATCALGPFQPITYPPARR